MLPRGRQTPEAGFRQAEGQGGPRGRSLKVYTLTATCIHTDVDIAKAVCEGTAHFT